MDDPWLPFGSLGAEAPRLSRADRGGAMESVVDYIQWVVCLLLACLFMYISLTVQTTDK